MQYEKQSRDMSIKVILGREECLQWHLDNSDDPFMWASELHGFRLPGGKRL